MTLSFIARPLRLLRHFRADERGATAIEYALFAALIGAVIAGTVTTLGGEAKTSFTTVESSLKTANGTP